MGGWIEKSGPDILELLPSRNVISFCTGLANRMCLLEEILGKFQSQDFKRSWIFCLDTPGILRQPQAEEAQSGLFQ